MKSDEFTVDADKWVCGFPYPSHSGDKRSEKANSLGKGKSCMENSEGEMCCLGHCMLQLGFDVSSGDDCNDYPSDIVHFKSNKGKNSKDNPFLNIYGDNTDLSEAAADINDDRSTTIRFKIAELKKLFALYGLTLRFKNIKKYL